MPIATLLLILFKLLLILFIAFQVLFFVALFWAYFDAALFPSAVHPLEVTGPDGTAQATKQVVGMVKRNELTGGQWPPKASPNFKGAFDPWGLPLVSILILLTSGITVSWAHHALLNNDRRGLKWGLLLTIMLGVLFTVCQFYEYVHNPFKHYDHIYGSLLFVATGYHGAQIMVGTLFLIACLVAALAGRFTPERHFGFEAAAWYWRFVDVVWLSLFVFACVYVLGASH